MFVRSRRASLALLVVLAAHGGACSLERSGYQFVRSKSTGTYLKVPSDWKVHGNSDVRQFLEETGDAPEGFETAVPFVSTFGADADLIAYPFDPFGRRPAGMVRVRRLGPEERDLISFASLRDEIVGVDAGSESGEIEVIDRSEFDESPSVRGQRVVFAFTEQETNERFVIDQTTLVDDGTKRVYLLALGCRMDCYERDKGQIDDVVTSLTIKER